MVRRKPPDLGDSLVEMYPELLGHLVRRTGTRSDAEDLLQELWLRVQKAPQAGGVAQPRAYLFRAAENIARDFFRWRARRGEQTPVEDEVLPDPAPRPEVRLDDRRRVADLGRIVRGLPPRQREALLLLRVHGLPPDEVARRMGISRSGVEKLLRKALITCRARLGDADGGRERGGDGDAEEEAR